MDYDLEEAKKLNQQSAQKKSMKNMTNAFNQNSMEAGTDFDLQEAKDLNDRSRTSSSGTASSSSSSSSSNLDEVKQANQKSRENKQ